jgi:hypothetical protein
MGIGGGASAGPHPQDIFDRESQDRERLEPNEQRFLETEGRVAIDDQRYDVQPDEREDQRLERTTYKVVGMRQLKDLVNTSFESGVCAAIHGPRV